MRGNANAIFKAFKKAPHCYGSRNEKTYVVGSELAAALYKAKTESCRISIVKCTIVGSVNLDGIEFAGWLDFEQCEFHGSLNVKHTGFRSLYCRQCNFHDLKPVVPRELFVDFPWIKRSDLRQAYTDAFDAQHDNEIPRDKADYKVSGIRAPGLKLAAGFRFGPDSSAAFIDLRTAAIDGDVVIERSVLNPRGLSPKELREKSYHPLYKRYWARDGCALYARGGKFASNVTIESCDIYGEIFFADAQVLESFYLSRSIILQPWDLAAPGDSKNNADDSKTNAKERHYAIQADRLKVGGRFSVSEPPKAERQYSSPDASPRLPSTFVFGKIRLNGAQIGGALIFTDAIIHSNRKMALSFIGATIRGLVSFSSSRISTAQNVPAITGKRAEIHGDFYLHQPRQKEVLANTPGLYTELSLHKQTSNHPMELSLSPKDDATRQYIEFLPTVCRNQIISDCGNDGLSDDFGSIRQRYFSEKNATSAIKDAVEAWIESAAQPFFSKLQCENKYDVFVWNRKRTQREDFFWCPNGLDILGVTVLGAFHAEGALIGSGYSMNPSHAAINAERAKIGKGVFLKEDFFSFGNVNFRRARIDADFTCGGAVMLPAAFGGEKSEVQENDATDLLENTKEMELSRFNITLGLSGATINGNLDLSSLRIVQPDSHDCAGGDKEPKNMRFAIYANRVNINGAAFMRNGFAATGSMSFVSADIKKSLFFEPVIVQDEFVKEVIGHDGSIGKSWRLDLEAANIQNTLSLRLMMAGIVVLANDNTVEPSEFTLKKLEQQIIKWKENELARHDKPLSFYTKYFREKLLQRKQNDQEETAKSSDAARATTYSTRQQSRKRETIETRIDNIFRRIRRIIEKDWIGREWRKRRLFDVVNSVRFSNPADKGAESDIKHVKGVVDLTNADADTYFDDFDYAWNKFHFLRPRSRMGVSSWPLTISTILEGFTYTHFGTRGIDEAFRGITRIEWLKTQYIRTLSISRYLTIVPWVLVAFAAGWLLYVNLWKAPIAAEAPISGFWQSETNALIWTSLLWALIGLAPIWIAGARLLLKNPFLPPSLDDPLSRGHRTLFDKLAYEAHKSKREQIDAETSDGLLPWHAYRSQPWLQAAKALRDAGQERQARRVLLSRERLNVGSARVGVPERILRQALLLTFGRGLVRWYPVLWFTVVYVVAVLVYHVAFDLNMMRPAEAVILTHLEKTAETDDPKLGDSETLNRLPTGYNTPRALIYAFEVMTPGLPMLQETRWGPCPSEYVVRQYDADQHKMAAQTRVCRALIPVILSKRLPLGSEPFVPTTDGALKQESLLFNGPCGVVIYSVMEKIRGNKNLSLKDAKEELRAFYSKVTISACFIGVNYRDNAFEGRPRLNSFFERDMLRQSTWMFITYGWILIGGFAISLSQLLLREA